MKFSIHSTIPWKLLMKPRVFSILAIGALLVALIIAGFCLWTWPQNHTGIVLKRRMAMRGDIEHFLDEDRVLIQAARHFEIWNVRRNRLEARLDYFDGQDLDRAASFAILPDSNRMLIGNELGEVELWDIKSGNMLYSIPVHSANGKREGQIPILGLAYSKLRDSFFTSSGYPFMNGEVLPADSVIKEWDLATGELKRELTGHMAAIGQLAALGDGDELLSCSGDGTMRIWDLESGEEVWREGEPHPPTTSDGDGEGTIQFSQTGRLALAVSPDGKYFCRSGGVYDVERRTRIGLLRRGISSEPQVVSIAFSPDSKRVLIGDRGGVIRLWDVATSSPIAEATMYENGAAVGGVAISPSGDNAISTGGGSIPFFNARPKGTWANEGAKMILWRLPTQTSEPAFKALPSSATPQSKP